MKSLTIIIFIILSFVVMSISNAQDTIHYGEDSRYLFYDWDSNSCSYSNSISAPYNYMDVMYGSIIILAPGTDVYGLSCLQENIVGGGVTLMLLKYIGKPELLNIDMLLHDDTIYTYHFGSHMGDPLDTIYQIVDSVHIDRGALPNRYMHMKKTPTLSEVVPLYERYFDTVYHIDDSSIYFVTWHGYDEVKDGVITCNPLYHLFDCQRNPLSVEMIPYQHSYLHPASFHVGRRLFDVAIFPIIENVRQCPSVPVPEVSVDRRLSTVTWSGNPRHCEYEVAIGDADQPISSYERIFTDDTFALYRYTSFHTKYACSVRALCCMDGDSIWSWWSDTVQFERESVRVDGYSSNIHWGYVLGSKDSDVGDTVLLIAVPRGEEYWFSHWSGGETSDTLRYEALRDTSFIAYFYRVGDSTGTADTGGTTFTDGIEFVAEGDDIHLMPNPANDKVNITCSYVINTCHVFTLDGREVEAVPVNDRYATLDVKGWVPGVYIVVLHTHAGMVSRRLVVK